MNQYGIVTRADVVREAKSWVGITRWAHQQSRKGVGCDCIGLVVGVARALGIEEAAKFDASAEIRGYGREPDPAMTLRACGAFLDPCREPVPGSILYLRVPKVAHPMHFALVSDHGRMIHAIVTAGRVVEHRLDEVWRSRIAGVFCYRGLDG
jgi:NlpC/P60 family putative phage cell wall peptidase